MQSCRFQTMPNTNNKVPRKRPESHGSRGRPIPRGSFDRRRSSSHRSISGTSSNTRRSSRGSIPRQPDFTLPRTLRVRNRSRSPLLGSFEAAVTSTIADQAIKLARDTDLPKTQPSNLPERSGSPSGIRTRLRERRSSVTFDLENTYVRTYKPSPRKFYREDEESTLSKIIAAILMSGTVYFLSYQSSYVVIAYYAYIAISQVSIR
jgi:hypothetical protein